MKFPMTRNFRTLFLEQSTTLFLIVKERVLLSTSTTQDIKLRLLSEKTLLVYGMINYRWSLVVLDN